MHGCRARAVQRLVVMARPFPTPVLLALVLATASFVSNAGVAEAAAPWWSGWRWDCLFPKRRGHGHGHRSHAHGDHGNGGHGSGGHGADDGYGHRSKVASIVTEEVYRSLFLHKDDADCPARGFYDYASFLRAAERFPEFGAAGNRTTRRREVAAFLAQISHETTGGWATAPDGPFAWGLCFKEEIKPPSNYCDATSTRWPCVPGKSYHGRGPMQLSWNFNYGPAGEALGFDGLGQPELVASDPEVAFKTALWFWMTPQPPKPSCHDVMVGKYQPSAEDAKANRLAGFGLTTNIINGGIECNKGDVPQVDDRIGYYRRYCKVLGVKDVGPNLDCARQEPYGSS